MTRKINNSYLLGQSNAPTAGGDMLKIRIDGTPVWEEVDGFEYINKWFGGRGIFAGVNAGIKDTIDYITINTPGNATDFGNLSEGRFNLSGCSDGSRGVFGGGYNHSNQVVVTIDYITIASTGNATDFGNLITDPYGPGACSDGSRGIWAGGLAGDDSTHHDVIQYITISTTGNATDFGDLTTGRAYFEAASDGTKGIFPGGYTGSGNGVNTMDYFTISTTGDALDFC